MTAETNYCHTIVLWKCDSCGYIDDDYKFIMKFDKVESPGGTTFTVINYCPKCNSTNVNKNYKV